MSEKGYNIISRIAGFLLLVVLGAILAIQVPSVQDRIISRITAGLDGKIDGTLSYSDIKITPTGALLIKDLLIKDNEPYTEDIYNRGWQTHDTLFFARTLTATLSPASLFDKGGIHIGRAQVDGGVLHLAAQPCDPEGRPGPTKTNLERIFRLTPHEDVEPQGGGDVFEVNRIRIRDFHFTLTIFGPRHAAHSGHGINYEDIDVRAADIRGHGMKFSGGRMKAVCDRGAGIVEKSGYRINNITGNCTVGMGKTLVEDIHLVDPWSDARFKYFSMTYRNTYAFPHFLDRVLMEAEFKRSCKLSMTTVSYLTTALKGNTVLLDITRGHAKGYVNDFSVDNFVFTDLASGISGTVNGTGIGLPDIGQALFDVRIDDLKFDTAQMSQFLSECIPDSEIDLGGIAPGKQFNLNLHFSGPVNKAALDAALSSSVGTLTARADVRNLLDPSRDIELSAFASAQSLDIGKFTGSDAAGPATFTARARAVAGKNGIDAILDSLIVDKISILGREYNGIDVRGDYDGNSFSARMNSSDPNLLLSLDAGGTGFRGRPENSFLRAEGDFTISGFDSRNVITSAGAHLSGNITGLSSGNIELSGLRFRDSSGWSEVGDASATFILRQDMNHIGLLSSFADASFDSSAGIAETIAVLQAATVRRDLPALFSDASASAPDGTMSLNLNLHDSRDIIAGVFPGIYIEDGTSADLRLDGNGQLSGRILSPRLAYGKDYIKGLNVVLDNLDNSLNVIVTGDIVNAGGFALSNAAFTGFAQDNEFSVALHYDNLSALDSVGELYVAGDIARDSDNKLVLTARPLSSYIQVKDDTWLFGESSITLRGSDIIIDNFSLANSNQAIVLDGGISSSRADTLNVTIDNFDIALVDNFLEKKLGFSGKLNGRSHIISPTATDFAMMFRLDCDSLLVGGVSTGAYKLAGNWDRELKRFNAYLCNTADGRDALFATASYAPDSKTADTDISLNGFSPAVAAPFVNGILDNLGGGINGRLTLRGPIDGIELGSDGLSLDNLTMRVALTGVPYTLNGPLHLDNSGLHFDGIRIHDSAAGTGNINGSIRFDRLRDIATDIRVDFRSLEVLKADETENGSFYGHLLASGRAAVTGPFNALHIDGNVRTTGDGEIHIPLNSALVGSTSDLLTFTQQERELDAYERMMLQYPVAAKPKGNLSINATVSATPGVRAFLEIDKNSGSILSFNGEGSVNMDIRTARDQFDMSGDYNIAGGKFHFNTAGIIDKDFTIQDGGSIKFGGDLMDTDLDITALYNLKASLNTLLADTTTVATRRAVQCGIHISDKLRNPKLDFTIDVPDLDPTTKSQVEGALNTEDKVQKQFAALLLLNSFIPSEQSGVFNGTNMLYNNVSAIMLGQVNSILQKLNIPLDLGFNYQQSDGGTNIFDVAISTQLFNNRVIVNGSVGNRQNRKGGRGTDFAGDLDIDIKLDKPGQFRLNLFTHSADEYTNFLDYSQRSGVGVSYQKEFNGLKDLFRRNSSPNGQRNRQQEAERHGEMRNGQRTRPGSRRGQERARTVTIDIDE